MKNRIMSIILISVLLLAVIPFQASAADATINSLPNAKIQYSYTTSTPVGTIRYISQSTGSSYFNWSYWPSSYSLSGYATPGTECGTACISMAISYVGVNKTPYDILAPYDGYTMFIDWGNAKHSNPSISDGMNNYANGNGKYSPVVIKLPGGGVGGANHYVMLAGKISENSYHVIDPASDSIEIATVNGTSVTYRSRTYAVSEVHQWYNAAASLEKPKYYLDLNGYLDGVSIGNISGYGTADVYINGNIVANDVSDYYTQWPAGTKYEIKDIKTSTGHAYTGVKSGSLSGTIGTSNVATVLSFVTTSNIVYFDATGSVWKTDSTNKGSTYTLSNSYPTKNGNYFCGWSYANGASTYEVCPGDTISVSGEIKLYPVYVTHEEATSGEAVPIYNIQDFTDPSYNVEKVEIINETKEDISYWGDWSDYTTTAATASSTLQVRTTPLYRYYYFLCPSCGRHEPFWGKSDCGAQIPESAWHIKWSTIPYSQSSYKTFSYTTAKYYTTSLGDGQMWCFSSGNVNATAIGTQDSAGSDSVIVTGYSTRKYIEKYNTKTTTETAYIITRKEVPKITISYNANSGTGAPEPVTVNQSETVVVSSKVPTRGSYTFLGWATNAGALQPTIQPGDMISSDVNIVLYAVWKENKVDIPSVHFNRQNIYHQGQFADVNANQWFTGDVAGAFEFGLMKGESATTFNPYGDVTIAEAITMAARIHSIYTTGRENFVQEGQWYQVYLDYAYNNGIISHAYYNCDVTHKATRAQFAVILAKALPDEGLYPVNNIADNAIPDVKMSADYSDAVYKLYRAGILAGGDSLGTFSPSSFITRAEAAAVASRMAESNNRKLFSMR